ncbi:MAG: hypothetical protein LCH54_11130 [Bacteroidetes bacterium]|nr:hypothetical protein [Bacteroidota bacterium]MCA0446766.1 hypothetical protein [Bacteroidota bacterium]
MAEPKSKNTGLVTVLWCDTCRKRPAYLIKGYKCPDCGATPVKKDVPKETAFPKREDPENDSLAWLEG